MTILNVPDMHCQNCVRRISAALTAADIPFSVSLDDHTVTIERDSDVEKAKEELGDLGFDAE